MLEIQGAYIEKEGIVNAKQEDYAASLKYAEGALPDLLSAIEAAGWDAEQNVYKLGETRIAQSS